MKPGIAIATILTMTTIALAAGGTMGLDAIEHLPKIDPDLSTGDRVHVLLMEGNNFNGETWPNTPLLEAYAGERMHFIVHTLPGAEMHTFHLHGHPWEDLETGNIIDTVLLHPSQTHLFTVTAGLDDEHHGDWLYHCHVTSHFNEGMWGLLRVYPHTMTPTGPLDDLTITLTDANQDPVTDATITLRHDANAPTDPTPQTTDQGTPIQATVHETRPGTYTIQPDLPPSAEGELIIQAHHPTGDTLTRLTLEPDGTYEENRHTGLQHIPTTLEPTRNLEATMLLENTLDA